MALKFVPKISGVRVEGYEINKYLFDSQIISLTLCMEKIERQETMDFLLDNFRFTKGMDGNWYAIIDGDTNMKLSIMEYYPEYEKEMISYFGEKWLKQYIRFNH